MSLQLKELSQTLKDALDQESDDEVVAPLDVNVQNNAHLAVLSSFFHQKRLAAQASLEGSDSSEDDNDDVAPDSVQASLNQQEALLKKLDVQGKYYPKGSGF